MILRPAGRFRSWLAVGSVLALVVGLIVYKETRGVERDWHAVRAHVSDIERALRRHEADAYVRSGREEGPPLPDDTEQRLVRNLEWLSHLEGLAMTNVEIRIDRDKAFVTYRIEGRPALRHEPPPRAGELVFTRATQGWRLVDSRLIE